MYYFNNHAWRKMEGSYSMLKENVLSSAISKIALVGRKKWLMLLEKQIRHDINKKVTIF